MKQYGYRQFDFKGIVEGLPLPSDLDITTVEIIDGFLKVYGFSNNFEKKDEEEVLMKFG